MVKHVVGSATVAAGMLIAAISAVAAQDLPRVAAICPDMACDTERSALLDGSTLIGTRLVDSRRVVAVLGEGGATVVMASDGMAVAARPDVVTTGSIRR